MTAPTSAAGEDDLAADPHVRLADMVTFLMTMPVVHGMLRPRLSHDDAWKVARWLGARSLDLSQILRFEIVHERGMPDMIRIDLYAPLDAQSGPDTTPDPL